MNSLGGGGEEKPYLVNAYDYLTEQNLSFQYTNECIEQMH